MKDLTPTVGPNSPGIADLGPVDLPDGRPPHREIERDVGGLGRQLEHLTAVPDPVDHLARPLATSTQIVTTAAVRRGARRAEAFAEPPPITRASRQ